MNKRGQAALEFLMTYGWAILVVLVVIGALAYFGVLNPSILLPEKCTLTTGLACKDHRIDSTLGEVSFSIENGMGTGMYITNMTVSGKGTNYFTGCDLDMGSNMGNGTRFCERNTTGGDCNHGGQKYWYVANGEGGTAIVSCGGLTAFAGKTKAEFTIVYFADDSTDAFAHTMTGELLARNEG